jgi:eukaryotic-like serine/threonine-protein kinase
MHPDDDPSAPDDWQVDALVAFDEALAAGRAPAVVESASSLQAVHHCQSLLERVWPRSHRHPSDLPTHLGRFQIESELGRGGFGIVFLATDTLLKRRVALKVPRPEVIVTPDFRRRFLREGEAASRLDHPHIVPIFETGEQGTICYIASAYCDGLTMAEWLRQRTTPVPSRLAAELVVKLARAVGHAHERGILHRDLKPRNILLLGSRTNNESDQAETELVPRICDFGLAKILDQDGNDTCSGAPLGSPAYMAPEQASGRHREIGAATDVYALGVILYELLVGRPPFQGETVLETIRHVSDAEPSSPRGLRPGVPRDLDTICMKCLEKRADRRYIIASDLTDDLDRFLAGLPVKARPVAGWVRVEKWARRRPTSAALAAVLTLALVVVIVGLAWSGARERHYNVNLRKALDQTRSSEQRAYRHWATGQVRLAQFHYDAGNIETASEILDDVRPEAGRTDPPGFAWSYLDRLCRGQLPQSVQLPAGVSACAISPNGRTVALGDDQGSLRLWDLVDGTVKPLQSHCKRRVLSLQFSPDGRT